MEADLDDVRAMSSLEKLVRHERLVKPILEKICDIQGNGEFWDVYWDHKYNVKTSINGISIEQ